MPEITFKKTIVEGIEGETAIAEVVATGIEDFSQAKTQLDSIKVNMMTSSLFSQDSLETDKDVGKSHDITWEEGEKGTALGRVELEILKDDKDENTEGCLMFFKIPRKISRAYSRGTPAIGILIARDAKDKPVKLIDEWRKELEGGASNYFAKENFVLKLDNEQKLFMYPTGSTGMFAYNLLAVHEKHVERQKMLTAVFTDVFEHEGEMYGFTVWNSIDNRLPSEMKGLIEDRCRKCSIVEPKEGREIPRIQWTVVSQEELKSKAIASKYASEGKLGFLFGKKKQSEKDSLLEQLLQENVGGLIKNRIRKVEEVKKTKAKAKA